MAIPSDGKHIGTNPRNEAMMRASLFAAAQGDVDLQSQITTLSGEVVTAPSAFTTSDRIIVASGAGREVGEGAYTLTEIIGFISVIATAYDTTVVTAAESVTLAPDDVLIRATNNNREVEACATGTGFMTYSDAGTLTLRSPADPVDLTTWVNASGTTIGSLRSTAAGNFAFSGAAGASIQFLINGVNYLQISEAGGISPRNNTFVHNDAGGDFDFRVEGDNAPQLLLCDAGLDAVQIGTTTAGAIADFRSSGIVFNENAANQDFRVEGDTDPNALVVDASADFVGIGNNAPSRKLHVRAATDSVGLLVDNASTGSVSAQFGNSTTGIGDTDGFQVGIDASENAILRNYENTSLLVYTNNALRTQINADGTILSDSCFQPGYAVAGHGTGAVYEITTSISEIIHDTTNSAVELAQAGTYAIQGHCRITYNATTYAAPTNITLKLRRTNNTAGDLPNGAGSLGVVVLTTYTGSLHMLTPKVLFTTANADDRIAMFIGVTTGPSAGNMVVSDDHIFAERIR